MSFLHAYFKMLDEWENLTPEELEQEYQDRLDHEANNKYDEMKTEGK